MDYRLDRVRIIKDNNDKVMMANRGSPVCSVPHSIFLAICVQYHNNDLNLYSHIKNMKNSKPRTVELAVYVIMITALLLGAWRLNSVYNRFKVCDNRYG